MRKADRATYGIRYALLAAMNGEQIAYLCSSMAIVKTYAVSVVVNTCVTLGIDFVFSATDLEVTFPGSDGRLVFIAEDDARRALTCNPALTVHLDDSV